MALKTEFVLFPDDHPRGIASMGIVTGEAHPVLERRMLKAAGYCFHEIAVAPAAETWAGRFQEFLFVRPMRGMACRARAIEHRSMGICLHEPCLSVGVASKADLVRPVPHHTREIRAVRVMACAAHLLGKRRVDIRAFPGASCLCMAGKTEVPAFRRKEACVLRGVGSMTGKASLAARNSDMARCHPGLFISMTAEAKFVAVLSKQFRVC